MRSIFLIVFMDVYPHELLYVFGFTSAIYQYKDV